MDSPPVEGQDPELAAFWVRVCRWAVAALQVVGGLFGLYYVLFGPLLNSSRIFFLLTFLLFAASVLGGVLLALDKPAGVAISLIIQLLQLCQIATEGLVYSFLCGVQLVLGLRSTENGPEVGFSFYFPVRFLVSTDPSPMLQGIGFTGVNAVAVLAIVCLLYVRSAHLQSLLPTSEAEPTGKGTWPPAPEP